MKPNSRAIVTIVGIVLVLIASLFILIQFSPKELLFVSTESAGKDTTLTGRTDLWQIAVEAIKNRPWFGWGFDSHISVKTNFEFDIKNNHYHNGFLDTTIAGGLSLLFIAMYNLAKFTRYWSRAFSVNSQVYPLLVPFVILIINNISEYSLMRPNSQLWLVYTTTFVVLSFTQKVGSKNRTASSGKRRTSEDSNSGTRKRRSGRVKRRRKRSRNKI